MNEFFTVEIIERIVSGIANVFTIAASGIAIYLFFFKGSAIKSAIRLLLNYSVQMSLNEMKGKLESLNELNANDSEHKIEVINILNEIEGQLKGNPTLKDNFEHLIDDISKFTDFPKELTEPKKRSIVSEIREMIRNINVKNYEDIYRGKP